MKTTKRNGRCHVCGAPLDNPRRWTCDACKAENERNYKLKATRVKLAELREGAGHTGLYTLQCKIAKALGRPVPPKPGARRPCRVPPDAATHTHRNADGATVTSRGTFGWSGR